MLEWHKIGVHYLVNMAIRNNAETMATTLLAWKKWKIWIWVHFNSFNLIKLTFSSSAILNLLFSECMFCFNKFTIFKKSKHLNYKFWYKCSCMMKNILTHFYFFLNMQMSATPSKSTNLLINQWRVKNILT